MSTVKDFADTSNLQELKTVCDQHIVLLMKKSGYKEIHFHQDVVLALGYIGAAFCLADFLLSYKHGFNQTVWFSYISVTVYALTTLASYVYAKMNTTGVVYYGEKDGARVKISSHTAKHQEYYHLTINTSKPSSPQSLDGVAKSSLSFGEYYYSTGSLSKEALQSQVQSLISLANDSLKAE